jgi:hypothetical protein
MVADFTTSTIAPKIALSSAKLKESLVAIPLPDQTMLLRLLDSTKGFSPALP